MISPVKAAIGPSYSELEVKLIEAIHIRFGLPASVPPKIKLQIKKADKISAWMEATLIAGFKISEANKFFTSPPKNFNFSTELKLRQPIAVRNEFIKRFSFLLDQLHKS